MFEAKQSKKIKQYWTGRFKKKNNKEELQSICVILEQYCQGVFYEASLVITYSPHNFEIFLIFLKSFDNSWGNSYVKFVLQDIEVWFTCGESNQH